MAKKILLFLNGESGTGKTFFKENIVPNGVFHNLISAASRDKRVEEKDGESYYFRSEDWFEQERAAGNLATYLFVNDWCWQPGDRKWLYGVPVSEIYNHLGENLIYDVIQPCYTRELIDWFKKHKLDQLYEFHVAWFLTETVDNMEIAKQRAAMKNDTNVRTKNTCNIDDFNAVEIKPDFITRPRDNKPNMDLIDFVRHAASSKTRATVQVKPFTRTQFLQREKQYNN